MQYMQNIWTLCFICQPITLICNQCDKKNGPPPLFLCAAICKIWTPPKNMHNNWKNKYVKYAHNSGSYHSGKALSEISFLAFSSICRICTICTICIIVSHICYSVLHSSAAVEIFGCCAAVTIAVLQSLFFWTCGLGSTCGVEHMQRN